MNKSEERVAYFICSYLTFIQRQAHIRLQILRLETGMWSQSGRVTYSNEHDTCVLIQARRLRIS
jgi:hypothetical protein